MNSKKFIIITCLALISLFSECAVIRVERLAYDNLSESEYRKIIKNLSVRIEHYPDSWKEYYYRGIANFRIGEFELALDDFSNSIKINPQYTSAYFSRGTVFITMKKYNDAMNDMDKVLYLDPNHINVYHMRGRIHYLLQDYNSALNECNIYLKSDDKNINIKKLKALCLYKLNKIDQAITLMFEVKEFEDTYENAYILGVMFFAVKEYEKAFNYFNYAVKLNNSDAGIFNSRV